MWMSAYQTIQTRASLLVSTLLVVTSASAQLDITSVLTARNVKVMCLKDVGYVHTWFPSTILAVH